MCMILLLPSGVSADLTLYLLQISQLIKAMRAGHMRKQLFGWTDAPLFLKLNWGKKTEFETNPCGQCSLFMWRRSSIRMIRGSSVNFTNSTEMALWFFHLISVFSACGGQWMSIRDFSQSTSWLQRRTLNINVELSVGRVNWRRLFNRGNYIYLHEHHPRGHDFVSSNCRTIISAKTMPQRMCFRIIACTDYAEVLIRQKAPPVH